MSNRHLARTIALQTLFEWDFLGCKEDLNMLIERNIREFAPEFEDNGFTSRLVKGIRKHWGEINPLIVKYAPEWPLEQITACDRNVLRIGIYELKFDAEVPPRVAINEAIELAKTFGGESSGKFINGVLGSLYKDMEASGEKISTTSSVLQPTQAFGGDQAEDASKLGNDQNVLGLLDIEANPETGRREISAGGVVYRKKGEIVLVALIRDGYGKWALPKGHIEEGESIEVAALEEVREETGLRDLLLEDSIGTNVLTVRTETGSFKKPVHYFLIKTEDEKLTPPTSGEVQGAAWFEPGEALAVIGYDDARSILVEALKKLNIIINHEPSGSATVNN